MQNPNQTATDNQADAEASIDDLIPPDVGFLNVAADGTMTDTLATAAGE